MSSISILERGSRRLDESVLTLGVLDSYYEGTQPLSFLSPEAKVALGNRLRALAVNYPKLACDVLAGRLRIEGFRVDGASAPELWQSWTNADMPELQHVVHTEALAMGRSFVVVWGRGNMPVFSVESARELTVERDPVTRQVTSAVKRWTADNAAHAVVFTPEKITRYKSKASVPEGGVVPPTGWDSVDSQPNVLGVVPVVPFINRGRLLDVDGVSEMAPILDLTDAISKVTVDMLVSSEYFARPRRWATGVEVEETDVLDESGAPTGDTVAVNPFSDNPSRVWQVESPEARFGEFAAANLSAYESATRILTQQIGALAGLPPHVLGVHGDQPASADAIRSAESALVQKAIARQRTFGRSWREVARLALMVTGAVSPDSVEPVWAAPDTPTPAQAADAASKLVASGIVPIEQALDDLGYSPEQVEAMRSMRVRDALNAAAVANPAPRLAS